MPTSLWRRPTRDRSYQAQRSAWEPVLREHAQRVSQAQSGFSMVELLVVVTIILILTATALITMVPNVQRSHANAGMEMVLGELRRAHGRADEERRSYRVTFAALNQERRDVGQGGSVGRTITGPRRGFVRARQPLILPDGIQFI